jgi:hypothetical protein
MPTPEPGCRTGCRAGDNLRAQRRVLRIFSGWPCSAQSGSCCRRSPGCAGQRHPAVFASSAAPSAAGSPAAAPWAVGVRPAPRCNPRAGRNRHRMIVAGSWAIFLIDPVAVDVADRLVRVQRRRQTLRAHRRRLGDRRGDAVTWVPRPCAGGRRSTPSPTTPLAPRLPHAAVENGRRWRVVTLSALSGSCPAQAQAGLDVAVPLSMVATASRQLLVGGRPRQPGACSGDPRLRGRSPRRILTPPTSSAPTSAGASPNGPGWSREPEDRTQARSSSPAIASAVRLASHLVHGSGAV